MSSSTRKDVHSQSGEEPKKRVSDAVERSPSDRVRERLAILEDVLTVIQDFIKGNGKEYLKVYKLSQKFTAEYAKFETFASQHNLVLDLETKARLNHLMKTVPVVCERLETKFEEIRTRLDEERFRKFKKAA